jgi:hypothetical protein
MVHGTLHVTQQQARLIAHHTLYPEDGSHNLAFVFRLTGPVDSPRLRHAAQRILTEVERSTPPSTSPATTPGLSVTAISARARGTRVPIRPLPAGGEENWSEPSPGRPTRRSPPPVAPRRGHHPPGFPPGFTNDVSDNPGVASDRGRLHLLHGDPALSTLYDSPTRPCRHGRPAGPIPRHLPDPGAGPGRLQPPPDRVVSFLPEQLACCRRPDGVIPGDVPARHWPRTDRYGMDQPERREPVRVLPRTTCPAAVRADRTGRHRRGCSAGEPPEPTSPRGLRVLRQHPPVGCGPHPTRDLRELCGALDTQGDHPPPIPGPRPDPAGG